MDDRIHTVDCRWLLALYAIIPVSIAAVATDLFWLDGRLLDDVFPSDPNRWAFWTVIFGLPHIIASTLTMADREYLGYYRRRLAVPLLAFTAITTAGYLGPQPVSYNLLFVFLAFYTIYHVLAQQLGLTLMMMGIPPSRVFRAWKWLAIFAGFAIYVSVYGQGRFRHINIGSIPLFDLIAYLAGALIALMTALAVELTKHARYPIGKWYLWGNVAMLVSVFLINEIGYTVFVIMIPRIIHDLTAFSVYITHDRNRNKAGPRNLLYRLTHLVPLPAILVLPLVSIAIAYPLTVNRDHTAIGIAVLTVSFLHYYFEGFIWRGDTPHKQHLGFRR